MGRDKGIKAENRKKINALERRKDKREEREVEMETMHHKKETSPEDEEQSFKSNETQKMNRSGMKTKVDEDWSKSQEVKALKEIAHELRREITVLAGKVKEITNENREIKAWARAISAKINTSNEEEMERENWNTIKERTVEGSPTPACRSIDDQNEFQGKEVYEEESNWDEHMMDTETKNCRDRRESSTANETTEDQKSKHCREKLEQRASRVELGMEMDEDAEYEKSNPPKVDIEFSEENRKDIPHRSYLEGCFRKQIGFRTDTPHRININSFTDKRVAKGYQRVVTTCQGMYYEMKEEQIDWQQWRKRRATVGGDWCWRGEGVSLYQPTK